MGFQEALDVTAKAQRQSIKGTALGGLGGIIATDEGFVGGKKKQDSKKKKPGKEGVQVETGRFLEGGKVQERYERQRSENQRSREKGRKQRERAMGGKSLQGEKNNAVRYPHYPLTRSKQNQGRADKKNNTDRGVEKTTASKKG